MDVNYKIKGALARMPINKSELNKCINKLNSFILSIDLNNPNDIDWSKAMDLEDITYFSSQKYGSLILTGEDRKQYLDILKDFASILAKSGSKAISRNYLQKCIETAILRAIDYHNSQNIDSFEERAKISLDQLKQELTQPPTPWIIYLQVGGIDESSLPYRVGNVTFQRITPQFLSRFGSNNEQVKKIIKDSAGNWALAIVSVSAIDEIAAREMAISVLRIHVDVLNHFADIVFGRSRIYLPEHPRPWDFLTINQMGIDPKSNLGIYTSAEGPILPYSFSKEHRQRANKAGFSHIFKIIAKSDKTPLEEAITAGFQWSGRAAMFRDPEIAFVMYSTALESLLVGNGKNDVTNKIATRLAHLIADTLSQRKDTRKRMLKLYDLRSRIIHQGHREVSPTELGEMRFLTKYALYRAIHSKKFRSLTDLKELDDWFDEKILK